MTKSKNGIVTKGLTYLATDTLPVIVVDDIFSTLTLGLGTYTDYTE